MGLEWEQADDGMTCQGTSSSPGLLGTHLWIWLRAAGVDAHRSSRPQLSTTADEQCLTGEVVLMDLGVQHSKQEH